MALIGLIISSKGAFTSEGFLVNVF